MEMPLLNTADATLVMPLWAMGAVLILLIVLVIVALRRSAMPGSISALSGMPKSAEIDPGMAERRSATITRTMRRISTAPMAQSGITSVASAVLSNGISISRDRLDHRKVEPLDAASRPESRR